MENVLIVEDDWLIRHLLEKELKAEGFNVIAAETEDQFWHERLDGQVALVVFDMQLRGKLGSAVYQSLFDVERGVPVVFFEGLSLQHDENQTVFRDEHCTFFGRPVGLSALRSEVKYLFDKHPHAAAHAA